MPTARVLVISNPEDQHTIEIVQKLVEVGAQPILFYPEQLGDEVHASLVDGLSGSCEGILLGPGEQLHLNTVDTVWYRRPRVPAWNTDGLSPEAVDFARDEWRSMLEATYALMCPLKLHR